MKHAATTVRASEAPAAPPSTVASAQTSIAP